MKKILLLVSLVILTIVWGQLEYLNRSERKITGSEKTGEQDIDRLRSENTDMIRVLIKSDDYQSEYHETMKFYCDKPFELKWDSGKREYQADEMVEIHLQDEWIKTGEILVTASDKGIFYFPDLIRAEEKIGYEGNLEIRKTENGLLLINELPLEQYLCGVLPSEMSEEFPVEALKAQAVCARTYALQQREEERAKEFHADLDDSTSYQVYNNRKHNLKTDQAVRETEGLVMVCDGNYADARYYSTSCGLDLHMDLSGEAVFAAFIQEDQIRAVEAQEPLFRWKTQIRLSDFSGKEGWDHITSLEIVSRNEKGAVTRMKIAGTKSDTASEETLEGEYHIRSFLACPQQVIVLQDGSTRTGWNLLPSAFFFMNSIKEEEITGYEILGGGYGHGEGMSQNGAKHMAENGKQWEEILKTYFPEAWIEDTSDIAKQNKT